MATETAVPTTLSDLEDWVWTRDEQEWSSGWTEDFKRGYDTAVYEVAARLSMVGPCIYRTGRAVKCGREREDREVHVTPNERMGAGKHLWRIS